MSQHGNGQTVPFAIWPQLEFEGKGEATILDLNSKARSGDKTFSISYTTDFRRFVGNGFTCLGLNGNWTKLCFYLIR